MKLGDVFDFSLVERGLGVMLYVFTAQITCKSKRQDASTLRLRIPLELIRMRAGHTANHFRLNQA